MNAKAETRKILDRMKLGTRFSGIDLMLRVREKTGETHYPSTMLRYLREYRKTSKYEFMNVNKRKSIYEVIEKL